MLKFKQLSPNCINVILSLSDLNMYLQLFMCLYSFRKKDKITLVQALETTLCKINLCMTHPMWTAPRFCAILLGSLPVCKTIHINMINNFLIRLDSKLV